MIFVAGHFGPGFAGLSHHLRAGNLFLLLGAVFILKVRETRRLELAAAL